MLKTLKIFSIVIAILAAVLPAANAQQRRSRNAQPPQVEAPEARGIIVRAAFWSGAKRLNQEAMFIKNGRDYVPFQITEMAFLKAYDYRGDLPMKLYRKCSEEEAKARLEQGVPKRDAEYAEYATLPIPPAAKNVGILIPGDVRNASIKPILVNLDEKAFPQGSFMFVNRVPKTLGARISKADPDDKDSGPYETQQIPLAPGANAVSHAVKSRTVLQFEVMDMVDGKPKRVYANQVPATANTRSVILMLPQKDKQGKEKIAFQSLNVAPLPRELISEADKSKDDKAVPAGDPRDPNAPRAKPRTDKEKSDKPKRRRV